MSMLFRFGSASVTNQPPVADAGLDATAQSGMPFSQTALVSDDGLPSGTLTWTWTQISGPGTTVISPASGSGGTADASFTPSVDGTYTYQLTASDGALSGSDTFVLNYIPAGSCVTPTYTLGPVANGDAATASVTIPASAGTNDKYVLFLTLDGTLSSGPTVTNIGGISAPDDSVAANNSSSFVWNLGSLPGGGTVDVDFGVAVAEDYVAEVIRVASDAVAYIDATGGGTSNPGSPAVYPGLSFHWSGVDGVPDATWTGATELNDTASTAGGGRCRGSLAVSNSIASGTSPAVSVSTASNTPNNITVVFDADCSGTGGGGNNPPTANAGTDFVADVGTMIAHTASVADDGQPSGTLTWTWTQISGPDTVIASPASGSGTDASTTFNMPGTDGTYTMRLTASDGALTGTDDLIFDLDPVSGNNPPTANAGADGTFAENVVFSHTASVSDDGQPSGTLTWSWSLFSGPGTASFSPASGSGTDASTDISVNNVGTYVFELTASDGALTATDTVEFVVTAASSCVIPGYSVGPVVTGDAAMWNVPVPAQVSVDDLLYVFVATDGDSTVLTSAGAGPDELIQANNSTVALWTFIASAGVTSIPIESTIPEDHVAVCLRVQSEAGASPGPILATAGNNTGTLTITDDPGTGFVWAGKDGGGGFGSVAGLTEIAAGVSAASGGVCSGSLSIVDNPLAAGTSPSFTVSSGLTANTIYISADPICPPGGGGGNVTVPSVAGFTGAQAVIAMQNAGLTASCGSNCQDTVVSTNPGPGSTVPAGTFVTFAY